jgi:hypothetical protein
MNKSKESPYVGKTKKYSEVPPMSSSSIVLSQSYEESESTKYDMMYL